MVMPRRRRDPVEAAFVLPLAFAGLLLIGVIAVAARLHGAPVLALGCGLVAATAFVAEPLAVVPLAVVGCFAVAAFDQAPYGALHAAGAVRDGAIIAAV